MTDVEYLLGIIKGIVSNPDSVTIDRSSDDMGILLFVTVDPTDVGKIIGKEGNTIKAIRTIVNVFGSSRRANVSVKINDPRLIN